MQTKLVAIALPCLLAATTITASGAARAAEAIVEEDLADSVEASPMSPFIRIYALQYARRLTPRNELLLGLTYTNIHYDSGRSHAPGIILGFRRYLWRGAHLEYQLWPSYNFFRATADDGRYDGFELWNEFRPGYTLDFALGRLPLYLNLQWLFGFGWYGSESKPQAWRDEIAAEKFLFGLPLFNMPAFFLGLRF